VSQNSQTKPSWLSRAISTYNYHCDKRADDDNWTINHTARSLRRSSGSICEDLLIADWVKEYGNIERFQYVKDALAFIRSRKKQMLQKIHLD
jgi:hypothetical protein